MPSARAFAVLTALTVASACSSSGPGGSSQPASTTTTVPPPNAYWLLSEDGGVHPFGGAPDAGSMAGKPVGAPVVCMAGTPDGNGYWLLGADGAVFAFGDASFLGSAGASGTTPGPAGSSPATVASGPDGMTFPAGLVGIAPAKDGRGYWIARSDGSVLSFGDAPVLSVTSTSPGSSAVSTTTVAPAPASTVAVAPSSTAASTTSAPATTTSSAPVAGIAADRHGGFWTVHSDGTVDAYGTATTFAANPTPPPTTAPPTTQPPVTVSPATRPTTPAPSTTRPSATAPTTSLPTPPTPASPVIGISPSPGRGYWLLHADGTVDAYGDARPYPSSTGVSGSSPVVGIAPDAAGNGYWLASQSGGVYSYGGSDFHGAMGTPPTPAPVMAIAAQEGGSSCLGAAVPVDVIPLPGEAAGDGNWTPAARSAGPAPAIYTTTLRSTASSSPTGVAWIDATRTRTRLYAAPGEPSGTYAFSSSIALADRSALLGAFNSGFRIGASDGGWYEEGNTAVPLRNGAASLVIYPDGSATVGEWGRDIPAGTQVEAVRQNLDLLVDNGAPVGDLGAGAWGAVLGGGTYTWRSGIGVDTSGHLIYAGGPGLAPSDLAVVLVRAGCVRAMELDINPMWVTFSTYATAPGQSDPTNVIGTGLIPGMYYGPQHFLDGSARDFVGVFGP